MVRLLINAPLPGTRKRFAIEAGVSPTSTPPKISGALLPREASAVRRFANIRRAPR
jgi:hypothetical protein